MLFNSLPFAVFFVLVWATVRRLPSRHVTPFLLAASLVFYGLWHPPYLILLLADLGLNYFFLRRISGTRARRTWLAVSLVFTLGLLAYFKYAAMLVETLFPILRALSISIPVPEIFLPLGISFFSFQIAALAIDTYRARPNTPPPLLRYMLFISFFPQLIAGPIVRGHELLPQLERGPHFGALRPTLWLIVGGLFKKVVCSDLLLAHYVDTVFAVPSTDSAGFHLIALYSFAFQIYFDFSGYTDIARGLAQLLGFRLPENFAQPYLARSPSEFWNRWHMTLSRWLRDYLYIPLGGNRHGPSRTVVSLLLTMLLGGLWHGASWNFVAWGGLHGLILIAARPFRARAPATDAPIEWKHVPRILVTFHLMVLPWVFFRSTDFSGALKFLEILFSGNYGLGVPLLPGALVLFCAAFHVFERWASHNAAGLERWFARGPVPAFAEGALLGILVALILAGWDSGNEFIYFQF